MLKVDTLQRCCRVVDVSLLRVTLCNCLTRDLFGSSDLQLFERFIQFIGFTVI